MHAYRNEKCEVYEGVNNFEYFKLNRLENKPSSKRYSGGVIYIRNTFVSKGTVVFQSEVDIICVKINGQKLVLQNDLFACAVLYQKIVAVNL